MVSARQLVKSTAKTAVAVLFAGPVGGAREGINQAIELFWSATPPEGRVVNDAVRDVEAALSRFAESEHLPSSTVQRALDNAEWIIGLYGLTAAELVEAGLDADRAVALLLARAAPAMRTMDDSDVALCSRAIAQVYKSVVEHSTELSETTKEYRRAVLRRLDALESIPEGTRLALVRSEAQGLLQDPSRTWYAEYFPPSALLRAEYGAVPFWGRKELLDELDTWLQQPRAVAARLFVGAGGMGKTRLMVEWCRRIRVTGWRAGFLSAGDATLRPEHLVALSQGAAGVAVVVDYAETRTDAVAHLVGAALESRGRVRIVLLARSTADWWDRLCRLPDSVGDFLSGPAVGTSALAPVATIEDERQRVFDLAEAAFRRLLTSTSPYGNGPDGIADTPAVASPRRRKSLSGETYDRVLFILLKALAGVEGQASDDDRVLLDYALRREQRFWDSGIDEAGLGTLAGRPIRQAAALITLAGRVSGHDEAVALLSTAPLLSGQPAAAVARVAELFHRLYPGTDWVNGVQPDLLGEHLVSRAVTEDPNVLGVLVDSR